MGGDPRDRALPAGHLRLRRRRDALDLRVAYYSYSALGTDRYPAFTLEDADYPARLEVDYPVQLSRGLALVKRWPLAVPHYVVVAVFGAGIWGTGTGIGWGERAWGAWGGGPIGILVLFAAIVLLVTRRYPRDLFDLVMGFNRWAYRALVYAALMRDEYPPLRLDMGARESPPLPPWSGSSRIRDWWRST